MATPDLQSQPLPLCVGLVGGLGLGAGIHYYRELAMAHEARGHTLRLAMIHADIRRGMELVRGGQLKELAQYLAGLIDCLRAAGAEIAVVPAVTPHICADDLEAISPLPLVNILTATNNAIAAAGFHRVAVFGTRFTIETGLFGQLTNAEIVPPQPAEIDAIHETYVRIAQSGAGTDADRQELTDLAHRLIKRDRLDAILLAGTDLSLIFDASNTDFPHIDCAHVHLEVIMQRLFEPASKRQ